MKTRTQAGFSLIELIIAVSIMAILAGAAVPLALKAMTSAGRKASKTEIESLSEGVQDYFSDTLVLPATLADLEVEPTPAVPGWSGPYLPGAVPDKITGLSGYQVDAWSRSYDLTVAGDIATITSRAEDGMPGTTDDISIAVNVTYLRRKATLDQLRIINQAVASYNAQNNFSPALPNSSYTNILSTLVSDGFLPSTTGYEFDGWGVPFEPRATTPVVKIQSASL